MINYFDFYGLPVKFNIDEKELKRLYFQKLKANHPDFYINEPLKYQEALVNSSQNNEAYKCLSNVYSRANHLLVLSGKEFEDKLPPAFLMEMMDINEALSELEEEPNSEKLAQLKNEIESINSFLDTEFNKLTALSDNENSHLEERLKPIKENLLKHKYILRLKETLANIAALN